MKSLDAVKMTEKRQGSTLVVRLIEMTVRPMELSVKKELKKGKWV